MSDILLRINSVEFLDYTSVTVRYSMEALARSFSVTFSDKWLATGVAELPFKEGDPCELTVDGQRVIDGFIDDIPISYGPRAHSIQVTGRSWHGMLVDCSAIYKSGSWKNATLLDICGNVSQDFGIGVEFGDTVPSSDAAVTETFRRWSIEEEETVYELIARAAKMRGLFPLSDSGRNVILSKSSKKSTGTTLRRGENILSGTRRGSYKDRYSDYIVKSQTHGDADWSGAETTYKRKSVKKDEDVEQYRPLIVISDGQGTQKALDLRACWERNVRAGRSRRAQFTVQGVQKPDDSGVWEINETITVDDTFLDMQGDFLVIAVSITQDRQGTKTTLEVGAGEAFDVLIPPTKKVKKKSWGIF